MATSKIDNLTGLVTITLTVSEAEELRHDLAELIEEDEAPECLSAIVMLLMGFEVKMKTD